MLGELKLADLITHRVPFARAAEAYALLDDRAAETVQVVLDYA
jgi:threonine dehydrogenase-like Zn-dependent dehydrogenase